MTDFKRLMDSVVEGTEPSFDAFDRTQAILARRERRRRLSGAVAGLGAFILSVVVLFGGLTTLMNREDTSSPAAPTSVAPLEFPPGARTEGASTIVPVTFPDGTGLDVTFPTDLHLGDGGRLGTSGGLGSEADRTIDIYFGSPDTVPFLSSHVVTDYGNVTGKRVRLWEGSAAGANLYLVYEFGPWTVLIFADDMTEDEQQVWVRNLTGELDDNGYLVLHAGDPLFLAGPGSPEGPQIWLDGEGSHQEVGIVPGDCAPEMRSDVQIEDVGETGWFASWCDSSGAGRVYAYGGDDKGFVQSVLNGLDLLRGSAAP